MLEAFATTSWDDGAREDIRLADLLAKYDIPACFYIPRSNPERPVLDEGAIRELSAHFEIGGHTISHRRLTSLPLSDAKREIQDCKTWLQEVTGQTVRSFCYPGGLYTVAHVREVQRAGFTSARTADWMCLDDGTRVYEIPPSLHLYPHRRVVHLAHCLRRRHFVELARYLHRFRDARRPGALAELMLRHIAMHGGSFHLWGHSWEIAAQGLWGELEAILRLLASLRDAITLGNNAAQAERIRSRQQP
jgi:hypothetical protein